MNTTISGLKMIYLDMGHVITRAPNEENWKALMDEVGLPEEIFLSRYKNHRDEYDRGTMTAETFWSLLIEGKENGGVGKDRLGRLINIDCTCWGDFRPEMVAWSDVLRGAGYKTGILSNMPLPYAEFIRGKEWFNRFQVHVLSAEKKQLKPEPPIYKTAIAESGVAPEKILFIDDLPQNVAAAREAGIYAVQFTGVQELNRTVTTEFGLPPIV